MTIRAMLDLMANAAMVALTKPDGRARASMGVV